MAAGWVGPMVVQGHGAVRALQNKPGAEALPAQPLPWALGMSSHAELVYYGINTM